MSVIEFILPFYLTIGALFMLLFYWYSKRHSDEIEHPHVITFVMFGSLVLWPLWIYFIASDSIGKRRKGKDKDYE